VSALQLLEILLNGLPIGTVYVLAAAGLSIVFGVMGVLNVSHGELLAFGAFENLADRTTGSALSGEQQVVAIACALVSGARFLVLDEPTEGLAPPVTERVVETVAHLGDRGLTVLLVEQNVYVALDVCDHVYVLDDGGSSTTVRRANSPTARRFSTGTWT
jgi:ABC-type branched-subunit amino acid transport system ATPase component